MTPQMRGAPDRGFDPRPELAAVLLLAWIVVAVSTTVSAALLAWLILTMLGV